MVSMRAQSGFSLVELSIVLVILGLIVGGVLSGQSLIRAAELRSVTSEHSRFSAAVNSFRDKYFGLPGDMTNATQFWGALDAGNGIGSDCRGESSTLLTCNGDGNGLLQDNSVAASQTNEQWLFWKHLANAGLIEGSFSGADATSTRTICPSTAGTSVPGCNVPRGKLSLGMWNADGLGSLTGHSALFNGSYANVLAMTTGPNFINYINATMRAEELWNIDTKIDDGKPAFGNLVAARWNVCTSGAASVADGANAVYRLNTSDNRCLPVFRNVF